MQCGYTEAMIIHDGKKQFDHKCVPFTFGAGFQWMLQRKWFCSKLIQTAPQFNLFISSNEPAEFISSKSQFNSYHRVSRCHPHLHALSVAVHILRTKSRLHCFITTASRPTESCASSIFDVALIFQVPAKDLVTKNETDINVLFPTLESPF